MTDEKTTKQILAKRLKITDKEILDATYLAYKKLTEKKPYPAMKGIAFQIEDVAKRNPEAKGAKPEEFCKSGAIERPRSERLYRQALQKVI